MRARSILLLPIVAGCGYSTSAVSGDRPPHRIAVESVREPGFDIDAGGMVTAGVRRALARVAGVRLVGPSSAEYLLDLRLLGVRTSLDDFAEPGLRAAQYRVVVELKGILRNRDGEAVWSSPIVVGDAPFFSTAGRIEALDGASRRSLGFAADRASERLVSTLVMRLREAR